MSGSNGGGKKMPANLDQFIEAGKDHRFKPGEHQREVATKASKEAARARKRQKTMQEVALQILRTKVVDEDVRKKLEACGLDGTYNDAILEAMTSKAIKGSDKAAKFVRDTSGQAPRQTINVVTNDNYSADDIRAMSDADLAALLEAAGDGDDD